MRKMLFHAPLPIAEPKWTAPRTKVNALLQSHFSRTNVPSGDLAADQRTVLQQSTRLLQVWRYAPWLICMTCQLTSLTQAVQSRSTFTTCI